MNWIVVLKAYGDLLIAANSISLIDDQSVGLAIGSHLYPLYIKLGLNCPLIIVQSGNDIPDIFNIRKKRVLRAARSFVSLRSSIKKTFTSTDKLYIHNVGMRERLLFHGFEMVKIEGRNANVYLDYWHCFDTKFHTKKRKFLYNVPVTNQEICIFPDSRVEKKSLSISDVTLLTQALTEKGLSYKLCVFRSVAESIVTEKFSDSSKIIYYRDFDDLLRLIQTAKLVISVDSLPAHLAEYFSCPVFVIFNVINSYWLPYSSFEKKLYSVKDFVKAVIWANKFTK